MDGPVELATARLQLRKPTVQDAPAIFARYAGDVEVTRLLSWPRHESVRDSLAFVQWSDQVWSAQSVGPYLILDRAGVVVGSTGLDIDTPELVTTGYVLARDSWGLGYATEAAVAMVQLAARLGFGRLYAVCHPENRASARVLHKAGFEFTGILHRHTVFPNLAPSGPHDVEHWVRTV